MSKRTANVAEFENKRLRYRVSHISDEKENNYNICRQFFLLIICFNFFKEKINFIL